METLDEFAAAARAAAGTVSDVDEQYYARLVQDFGDWSRPEVRDPALRDECRAFLEREARLLDEARYEEWLALFAERCVYWVPATRPAGDPRREVAVAFDDRRRLEDRIYRLRTGSAWSQTPASRTVRSVSNVEVFDCAPKLMVRSNVLLAEFRAGETRLLAASSAYRLSAERKIEAKQVNLIECDQNLRNPSLIL